LALGATGTLTGLGSGAIGCVFLRALSDRRTGPGESQQIQAITVPGSAKPVRLLEYSGSSSESSAPHPFQARARAGFRSAALPAAVAAGVPPAAPRAGRPRDSRQDASATKRRRVRLLAHHAAKLLPDLQHVRYRTLVLRSDMVRPSETTVAQRNLRVTKWLGTVPALGICTSCNREFKVPLTAMRRVADAQESLRIQFTGHKCTAGTAETLPSD
jgi:hypothetical protein